KGLFRNLREVSKQKQEDDSCNLRLLTYVSILSFHISFESYLICLAVFCQERDSSSSPHEGLGK
ncbi:hypothetical protein KKF47_00400, partial [Patescibacteria group bacterium]|nr:hypothetical protein [Patescibacteria group bacterium]